MKNLRDNYIALARKDAAHLKQRCSGITVGAAPNIVAEAQLLLLTAAENYLECVDNPVADTATAIAEEERARKEYIAARSIQQ